MSVHIDWVLPNKALRKAFGERSAFAMTVDHGNCEDPERWNLEQVILFDLDEGDMDGKSLTDDEIREHEGALLYAVHFQVIDAMQTGESFSHYLS